MKTAELYRQDATRALARTAMTAEIRSDADVIVRYTDTHREVWVQCSILVERERSEGDSDDETAPKD